MQAGGRPVSVGRKPEHLPAEADQREPVSVGSDVVRFPGYVSSNFLNLHIWGSSSAGRAPALQAGGQGFDSPLLHYFPRSALGPKPDSPARRSGPYPIDLDYSCHEFVDALFLQISSQTLLLAYSQ